MKPSTTSLFGLTEFPYFSARQAFSTDHFGSMKVVAQYCLFLLLTVIPTLHGHQCDQPFAKYIQCMNNKVADKMNVLKSELNSSTQQKISECFTTAKCVTPKFSKAKVEHFVEDPVWQQRLNSLFSFVDDVDPAVSKCMVDHFVKVALSSLETCIHNNGPTSIRDFRFPTVSIDVNFKMEQIRQVVLNRMMVRTALKECNKVGSKQRIESLLNCLQTAKSFNNGNGLCSARSACLTANIVTEQCSKRLEDVLATSCSCLSRLYNKTQSTPLTALSANINQGLINGQVEEQFRLCHRKADLPFPHEKLKTVKEVFKATMVDIILQKQVPDALKNAMRLLLDVFKDFGREWNGILCSKCIDGQGLQLNLDNEVKQLKSIV